MPIGTARDYSEPGLSYFSSTEIWNAFFLLQGKDVLLFMGSQKTSATIYGELWKASELTIRI